MNKRHGQERLSRLIAYILSGGMIAAKSISPSAAETSTAHAGVESCRKSW